jgi:hypothetical protein
MIKTQWFTGGFLRDNGQYIELEFFGNIHAVGILIEISLNGMWLYTFLFTNQ